MVQKPELGLLVHSLAGRDAGEYYLIVGFLEPNYVLVANGENRPLQKPKKKNIRHVKLIRPGPPGLASKIARRKIANEELARALKELIDLETAGGEREGIPDDKKEGCN